MVERHDYAFPFRIDAESRQAQQATYPAHVAQLVRQVLLTTPGERTDLPEFGCGLRAMIFAGISDPLVATTEMLVQQALSRFLADHLAVRSVQVTSEDSELLVRVEYVLLSTRQSQSVEVRVS